MVTTLDTSNKILSMKITKTIQSKIEEIDFDNLSFGKYFSDHMFSMSFKNNEWQKPKITSLWTTKFKSRNTCFSLWSSYF